MRRIFDEDLSEKMMMMMFGIEIGRDADAFFSDLVFGFLMMHYIGNGSN